MFEIVCAAFIFLLTINARSIQCVPVTATPVPMPTIVTAADGNESSSIDISEVAKPVCQIYFVNKYLV